MTGRDSERDPGEGFVSIKSFDEGNPAPVLARLRLRSHTLSRKGRREARSVLALSSRKSLSEFTKMRPDEIAALAMSPRWTCRAFFRWLDSQILPLPPLPGIIVHYLFSTAATGAAVANGWSAGRRWALRHWASAPESGNPWQQGTCRGARRRRCAAKGVSQNAQSASRRSIPGGETEKGIRRARRRDQTGPAKRWLCGLAALIRPRRIPAKAGPNIDQESHDARHQMDS